MAETWHTAMLALQVLAQDPGLGGICIRARAGPVRDALVAGLPDLGGPLQKLHPAMTDDVLTGGVDLTATLQTGQLVQKQGLLQRKTPLLLTMAERATAGFAARLSAHLDAGGGPLILFDEGVDAEECPPQALTERAAFHVNLEDVPLAAAIVPEFAIPRGTAEHEDAQIDLIATVAAQLGIQSLRAPTMALRTAKALAVIAGRNRVEDDDINTACALVFAHRATRIPEPAPPPPEESEAPEPKGENQTLDLPTDMVLEAVRALLPDNLLDQITARRARAGRGNGTGAARRSNRRGRPLPSRAGRMSDEARIDLIATLRAAAPWQTIRRRETGRDGLQIRASDIHTKRFEEKSDRLLIFTVDASGSAALARLAEAKGAVELLLSQAYARRDHVALIAFRGEKADLLLPPTRSLVQTKRRLAALPGGGGTPLASGLEMALDQALQAERRGLTPTVCLLTDGRANIARNGTADRTQAGEDAHTMARLVQARGIDALVIDTGNRPSAALKTLSQTLDGTYLPMPRADATRLSEAVTTALGD